MPTNSKSPTKEKPSHLVIAMQSRYADAYRVADTIDWFGQAIKIAGALLAVVIFIFAEASLNSPGAGLIAGLVVASVFAVIGIIVAAQGQLLKATVDTAVNSSPFLNDRQKAATMSLSKRGGTGAQAAGSAVLSRTEIAAHFQGADANENEADENDEEEAEPASEPFCHHCGAEIVIGARRCATCNKPL
jgi:hypothetical protein